MTKYYYLFKVSIGRSIKEMERYKFNTVTNISILYIVFMAMFLGIKSFGNSFGISSVDMGSSIEGFIVGYFLWTILMMAYSGVAYGIINDASRGTLEQLNMSGIRLSTIVTVRSLADMVINVIISIIILFIIMATTDYWLEINLFSILLPIFIGIFSMLGIGLIFGGLALIFKKIQSLLNMVQYFLIALVIGNPRNVFTYSLIPFRPAADKVFAAMLKGYSFTDFSVLDYGIMIGNSILYFAIGLFVFSKCVKLAKKKGLLGQY